jgi:hypothetical protein
LCWVYTVLHMYQRLVAVLIVGAFGLVAYYLHNSDLEEIILYADTNSNQIQEVTVDTVTGKYLCTIKTGCKDLYQITLYLNGAVKLSYINKNKDIATPAESPEEASQKESEESDLGNTDGSNGYDIIDRGTWKFIPGGFIEVSITERNGESLATSSTIIIQSVTSAFLTKFTFDNDQYPIFKKPRFVREELIVEDK